MTMETPYKKIFNKLERLKNNSSVQLKILSEGKQNKSK